MPRTVWILLSVGVLAFVLAIAGAALLISSDSGTAVGGTMTLGQPPPTLELPLADDPDTLLLARRAGTVLVGLAARPEGPVQVAALDGEQAVSKDELSFNLNGRAAAKPCGYACWQLDGRGKGLLEVTVRGKALRWNLPLNHIDGRALYRRAMRVMESLRSYRYAETLTSGGGESVSSSYEVQPPARLRFRARDGFQSILIGKARWDFRDGRWERTPFPGFRATFMWDGARNPRLLDPRTLAVFDRQPVPAWFVLRVDGSGRVLRADMLAPSHFMEQRFSAFNAPLRIEPPR